MKLVIIGGFLGSGKTTLLAGLITGLLSWGTRDLVILENEVGEVSVDGPYLRSRGLNVRELYSGCVCCQLAGDLVTTLSELKETLRPRCVFLEASGVARLENILEVLDKYSRDVEGTLVISLADSERLDLLLETVTPLVHSQLKAADIVVLNKIDTLDGTALEERLNTLRGINPGAEVLPVSALKGDNLENLTERVGAWL